MSGQDEEGAVEAYLAQVKIHLPGGGRAAGDVVDELRDGLFEALEHRPARPSEEAAGFLVREFGDPRAIGAALAAEIRLRLARRHAIGVLLVLVSVGAGWRLYDAVVGTPASAVPTGWAEPVFLAALDVLAFSVVAAQAGAALTVLAVSLPIRGLAESPIPPLLGRATLLALALFGTSVLSVLLSIAPAHRPEAAAISALVTVAVLAALYSARSVIRHADHVHGAR